MTRFLILHEKNSCTVCTVSCSLMLNDRKLMKNKPQYAKRVNYAEVFLKFDVVRVCVGIARWRDNSQSWNFGQRNALEFLSGTVYGPKVFGRKQIRAK